MDSVKLQKILSKHKKWVNNGPGGKRADLRGADLLEANLQEADLREANLRRADLREANLRGANLLEANLQRADLQRADLQGADLLGADLQEADLPHYQIIPEEGDFIAFKKFDRGIVGRVLCRGQRVCNLTGRKIRVEKIKVLEFTPAGTCADNISYGASIKTKYCLNKWTKCDKLNDDIRAEYTHGIHVFITRKEAEAF